MSRREFLDRWGLSELKFPPHALVGRLTPHPADRAAAWELHVETATRIAGAASLP